MVGKAGAAPVALEEEVVVGLFADTTLGHIAMLKAIRTRLSPSMAMLNMCMQARLSRRQVSIDVMGAAQFAVVTVTMACKGERSAFCEQLLHLLLTADLVAAIPTWAQRQSCCRLVVRKRQGCIQAFCFMGREIRQRMKPLTMRGARRLSCDGDSGSGPSAAIIGWTLGG